MNIFKSFIRKIIFRETIVCLAIVIFIFIIDRVSKIKIINEQLNSNSLFINDYLNFDLVWNTGISFGLFSQNANIYYHTISFIIFLVIVFLSYIISRAVFFDKILFSLILGGAIGNFFDRIYYFAVPDFIDIHVNNFHWFTFNIADIFITMGVILLIIKDLKLNKK